MTAGVERESGVLDRDRTLKVGGNERNKCRRGGGGIVEAGEKKEKKGGKSWGSVARER